MDYHDKDYEENLHLVSEESPKISSVLRPFALPRFDFDDNLHGHLRFDGLVENEVFGIPGQEGNQWIEDFSRGRGGIVFCSSATESCALPRNDNVWSEAVSPESVEMLLKAVGQEEMVPSETVVEESNPVKQLGNSTEEAEFMVKQDVCLDGDEDENSVLIVAEAKRDIYSLGETIDIMSVHSKCIVQAHETKLPSYEVCHSQENSSLVTSKKLHLDLKSEWSIGESGDSLLNEPLSKQAETSFSIEKAGVQDVINDTDFPSTSFAAGSVVDHAEDSKDGCSTNDESMHETDVENVDSNMHKAETIFNIEKSGVHDVINDNDFSSTSFAAGNFLDNAEDSKEGCNTSYETMHEIDVENVDTNMHKANEIPAKLESTEGHVLPEKSSMGSEGFHMDGTGDLVVSSFTGDCCTAETMAKDARDAGVSPATEEDLTHHLLRVKDNQTIREDIPFLQAEVCEHEFDASSIEEEDKLPMDSTFIGLDDKENELGSTFCCQVGKEDSDQAAIESDLGAPKDYLVLETESKDTVSTPSCSVEEMLPETDEHDTPLNVLANKDLSKDTEFKATEELLFVQQEHGEVLGNETEKNILSDSDVARGSEIADKYSFSSEDPSGVIFDEASHEGNEKTIHPANEMIVQDNVAEDKHVEKPEEIEVVRSSAANFTQVPTTVSTVETDAISIGNCPLTPLNSGANCLSEEEETCTFDIRQSGTPSAGGSGTILPLIPIIQACDSSVTREGSHSTSGNKVDLVTTKEVSRPISLILDEKPSTGGLIVSSDRKSKRGCKNTAKDHSKKGNYGKETNLLRQTDMGDKSRGLLSPIVGRQIESNWKPSVALSTSSSLPDLNSSTPAFFQQLFTDLQQVQLRAQIFVYGSLIQGVAPDEACMVSAFDGSRSVWEPTWRACVESFQAQKSPRIGSETPVQSRTGGKASAQLDGQSFRKNEVLSAVVSRSNNKAMSFSFANPIIPLSSPMWNVSTPSSDALPSSNMPRSSVSDYPVVSPMHPFQSPHPRNLASQTTSGPSQVPFPVPLLASSSNPSFDVCLNGTPFSIPAPLKLITPAKELSLANSSGLSLILAAHTGGTAILPGMSSIVDLKKGVVSTCHSSVNSKSRKTKKCSGAEDVLHNLVPVIMHNQLPKNASTVEDLNRTLLLAGSQVDQMSTPVVSSHYSTSVTVTTPTFVPKGSSKQISSVIPTVSNEQHKSGDIGVNNRTIHVDEFGKVEEAKLRAEEAANYATAAVRNCEHFWTQLEIQKNSGLTPDSEVNMASAAAVIAASVSVAKAAAAAAKIASSAAAQAKQMADEAVNHGTASTIEYNAICASGPAHYFSSTTPISILRGSDRNNPSNFMISAAREAAKKRVEAATAASRHAENLDAILKAAELAADAVSLAGKIVIKGDPIPINNLLVAGPDGYRKASDMSFMSVLNRSKVNPENNELEESAKDKDVVGHVVLPDQRESSRAMVGDHIPTEESLVASVKHGESTIRLHEDKDMPSSAKANNIILEKNIETMSNSFSPVKYKNSAIIEVGSLVEVFKSRDDEKAWYLASVLSLNDGKALVSYANLHSDRGSEPLKEWVSVEAKVGYPAIIRIPHPLSIVQFEGVRKRQRAALNDYDWSVGDKVDAWVHDCWREGIIAENNKKNSTALSIHFPAQGETLVVKLWHLRPTVIWMDGQWTEWCRPGNGRISKGDSPAEKRAKLRSMITETEGNGILSYDFAFTGLGKDGEPPKLPLSSIEKTFNIGRTWNLSKPNAPRTSKPVIPKEGSRGVVFGVPKPAKKRKYMDVSKHYVSDRNAKVDVPGDSVKLSTFFTSQGSWSRGRRNKVNTDSRDKKAADGKVKGLKFGKPPSVPSRKVIKKDDSSSVGPSTSDASLPGNKSFVSNDIEMEPREENLADFGSFHNVSEGGFIFSSQSVPPENCESEGKLAPSGIKSSKGEENEKNVSDSAQLRRSNRPFQPTSRLLEGLQSSLTITKLPSSSQDKNVDKVSI